MRLKVVSATFPGAVAAEAKSNAAHWVILSKYESLFFLSYFYEII